MITKERPAPGGTGTGSRCRLESERSNRSAREGLAQEIADWILQERPVGQRKFFLNVHVDGADPEIGFHFRYKGSIGVAYHYSEFDLAHAWIVDALLRGYSIYRTCARRRWGMGYGRSLEQGVADY